MVSAAKAMEADMEQVTLESLMGELITLLRDAPAGECGENPPQMEQ